MQINENTDYAQIKAAWKLFLNTGKVADDVLRPEIAESWVRFFKFQTSDENVEPLSPEEIQRKQSSNRRMIEIARPVMRDIEEMLTNLSTTYVVALFDQEGDIIDLIERNNEIILLGHRCSEIHAGTNAPALALKKGQLAEVTGYEHLLKKYGKQWEKSGSQWHSIGAAIFNFDQTIAGVLGVVNMTGRIPAIKPMVSLGARMIEAGMVREQTTRHNLPIILNTRPQVAVATDDHGRIFCANDRFLDWLGVGNETVNGKYLSEYLEANIDYEQLFSALGTVNVFDNVRIIGQKDGKRKLSPVYKINKVVSGDDNNLNIIVLIFEDKAAAYEQKQLHQKQSAANSSVTLEDLIGESPIFTSVKKSVIKAANSSFNVLIEGESGTGKEMVAQAIHNASSRDGAFVAVNCGAIPRELLQSELFGYEEGAFTGAKKGGRPGKFELADGGTLFLDEIGEMPLEMQVSLLRFLQDRIITPVGGNQWKKVDVRIIAATNRNLYHEVQNGRFREDLYYRLNVIAINMPPLRERRDDIPLLARHILHTICQQLKIADVEIAPLVMEKLSVYHWPGNVRELQNVIERALVYADEKMITVDCLPFFIREASPYKSVKANSNLKSIEKDVISEVLTKHNGNISKTAQELGITRTTLYKKMDDFGIKKP